MAKTFLGLSIGDIIKTCNNEYCVVVNSRSYLTEVPFVPVKSLVNDDNSFTEIPGGKHGFKLFSCKEEIQPVGKTHFLALEWITWINDK